MSSESTSTDVAPRAPQNRHESPWTTRQKIGRLVWSFVQATLFRYSPHNAYQWRAMLLRTFGAKIASAVLIRPTVRVEVPWNIAIGEHTAIGDFAILYSLGVITLGKYVTISQYAHLCAGTHETRTRKMTLLRPPITIGDDCWIATDAFVGPNVTIGDRTILGARSSAFGDLPADVVAVGNPAKAIRKREFDPNG